MNKLLILAPALLCLATNAVAQVPVKPTGAATPPAKADKTDDNATYDYDLFFTDSDAGDGKIKRPPTLTPLADPSALVKIQVPSVAALPARQPFFARNQAITDSITDERFKEVETNDKLAEALGVPSYLTKGMDTYHLGVDAVRLRWGVQPNYNLPNSLPEPKAFQMRLPSYYSLEMQEAERALVKTPDDKILLARRAGAYPFTYGVLNLEEDAYKSKLEGNQMAPIQDSWNIIEKLLKEPVPAEAVGPILKGLEIVRYAPSRGSSALERRNIAYQIKNMKTALAALEPVLPQSKALARMVDAKSVLSALYVSPTDNKCRADAGAFVGSASQFATQNPDSQAVSLLAIAVIDALEKLPPAQLSARARSFKDANYAMNCANISLFLDEIGQVETSKTWAQMASEIGSDAPLVLLAQSKTLPFASRERFDLLRKCAFALEWPNRYKASAVSDLVSHADKFGDVELRRLAREELLMSRGLPYDWDKYAQFAWETGEWGNAYNANRLTVDWQTKAPQSLPASPVLPDTPDKLDPLDDENPRISPRVDAHLKGAFLMLKLGLNKASQTEYGNAIDHARPTRTLTKEKVDQLRLGATIGAEFEATFVLHRRFLRAQLAKSPNDANLKAALDRLVALQIMGTVEKKFEVPMI